MVKSTFLLVGLSCLPLMLWAEDGARSASSEHGQIVLGAAGPTESVMTMREVEQLVATGAYAEAERRVQARLANDPNDVAARQALIKLRIAKREAEIRHLIAEEADLYDEVLGHPDYEQAKALASGIDRQRLDMVEYLVGLQRYESALKLVNQILHDSPDQLAALQIKQRLLDKIHRRERERLERERQLRVARWEGDVIRSALPPDEQAPIPRTIVVFDEDLAEEERQQLLAQLRIPVGQFLYERAPLAEVLNLLFKIAGINYIINDEAIGEETLTLNLTDTTVETVLATIQRMIPVQFNYHGGAVYITDSENPVLVTEIYRLKSGLTNVLQAPSMSAASISSGSSSSSSSGGDVGDIGGVVSASAGGGGMESDIQNFIENLETLVELPDGSNIYLEPKSNTLYIRSSPHAIAEIKRLLKAIDYNSVQVLIETKFLEIANEAVHSLGVNWLAAARETQQDGAFVLGASRGQAPNPFGTEEEILGGIASGDGGLNITGIGVGTSILPNFGASISALERKNLAHTLSEPKVLTLNNATGVIDIRTEATYISDYENRSTSNTVIVQDGTSDSSSSLTTLVPTFSTIPEGFNLQVTPSVARNSDTITLRLTPTIREVSFIDETFPAAVGGSVGNLLYQRPTVRQRTLSTTLHIRDGQTIVLGGLITDNESEGRSGVPGLSSIPGLGRLFRNDSRSNSRSKLLIFVTGHIIDPSGTKYTDEVRVMRDTASVVLPVDVRAQAQTNEAEAREAAYEAAREAAQRRAESERNLQDDLVRRPSRGPRR